MKIYFASDAHLGARFHKDPLAIEKKLVRWLDSIKEDASAIYLSFGTNTNTSCRKGMYVFWGNWPS